MKLKKKFVNAALIAALLISTFLHVGGAVAEGLTGTVESDEEVMASQSDTDAELINGIRSQFFTGPILEHLDLNALDPSRMSDDAAIGTIAQFQYKEFKPDHEQWDPVKVLPYAAAAGFKWLRTGYGYRWVTDQMPSDTFTAPEYMDKWIELEAERGFKPLIVLTSGREHLLQFKDDPDAYTEHMIQYTKFLIDRYGDKIGALELINEPYHDWVAVFGGHRFGGGNWVEKYAEFTEKMSAAIKEAAPNLLVVNGNSDFSPTIEQLKHQPSSQIDVINNHHYPQRLSPEYTPFGSLALNGEFVSSSIKTREVFPDFKSQVESITGRDLPLWVTETGVHTKAETEVHQAKDALRVFTNNFIAGVDKTFYFNLVEGKDPEIRANHYGLLTTDYQPKPAFFAIARLNALTQGLAELDPNFQAAVTNIKVSADSALPLWSEEVKKNGVMYHVEEEIIAEKLNLADGRALLAVWSTAHTESQNDPFVPRVIEFTVNQSLGIQPVLVDPLSGESQILQTRNVPGNADYSQFTMSVKDYPQYVLIHE